MSLCDTCKHYSRTRDNCLKTTITAEMITENICETHEKITSDMGETVENRLNPPFR
jgi:hypothetical protein